MASRPAQRPFKRRARSTWRRLGAEQKVASGGALLLILSTPGAFSWVEGAIVLVALAVLGLIERRVARKEFHLPFGDGTVIAASGVWCGVLISIRVLDRPLGQNVLALACAGLLVTAGMRERAKRPPDDLPPS